MIFPVLTMALAAQAVALPPPDAGFEQAATTCGAEGARLRAVAGFFGLAADQAIAEYQPNFVLTGCLADAVRGHGRLLVVVEGGDRIAQVVLRTAVLKALKRDAARYQDVATIVVKPGQAVPAERAASLDRIVITGEAPGLLADPKHGAAILRALRELSKPTGLLGIVDVPDRGGVDVGKLTSLAREAGWEPAGETGTPAPGLLLLKFRRSDRTALPQQAAPTSG